MEAEDEITQRKDVQRRLKLASILCLIFLVAELVGGFISGSLAVLSDAAHLTSDLMSFLFAVAAGHLASMKGSKNYTYGYRRWEVLAALFSMASLAICSVFLEVEGIRRLLPYITGTEVTETVDGEVMSIIAFIGVVVNVALALVLGVENHVIPSHRIGLHRTCDAKHMPGNDHNHDHNHVDDTIEEQCRIVVEIERESVRGSSSKKATGFKFGDNQWHIGCNDHSSHSHGIGCSAIVKEDKNTKILPSDMEGDQAPQKPKGNINLRAAYLHVLSDLAQSVAVLIAGVVIWYEPEWRIIDPILTIIFCPIIFYSTLGVIRSSINILLEGVPPDVNFEELQSSITSLDGIARVYDLHVWSISHGAVAMTLHATTTKDPKISFRLIDRICTRYGIGHCTVQLEQDDDGSNNADGPGTTHCYDPSTPTDGEYELVEQHEMA